MKQVEVSQLQFESRKGYERSVVFTTDDFGANTKLQVMRLAPSASIPPHKHAVRTEAFKILSGQGEIIINGEAVASSTDQIVLCQPGDVHGFVNYSATESFTFMVIRTNDPGNEDMIWIGEHDGQQ